MKYIFSLFLFLWSNLSFGEGRGNIVGKVTHLADSLLGDVEIFSPTLNLSVFPDNNGNFSFENIPFGHYQIYAYYFSESFGPFEVDLAAANTTFLKIPIKTTAKQYILKNFTVAALTKSTELKNSGIKADIISLKSQNQRSNALEEIINRVPGIKIRNTGGLGASENIMVGGFSGNSVKFLYDNIPIDYLGSNYGLGKVPVNALDRVEIFKGVLPTSIGTDALGSAINLVPAYTKKTSGSISLEQGSFGTFIASINATIKLRDKLFVGTNTFFNYSKNNYLVDNLPFRNPQTGQVNYIKARLFHNAYKQYSTEAFVQVRDLLWTDLIEFKVNVFDLEKEIQNDAYSRARPFGAVSRKENGHFIPSLKFKKNFFNHKLSLNQFMVYSKIQNELFDTLRNVIFDWKGGKHSSGTGSEMGNLNLKNGYLWSELQQITSRTYLNYLFDTRYQLEANVVWHQYNRKSNLDQLNPKGTFYSKMISNVGLNANFFDGKLESNTQFKYLYGNLSGQSRPQDYPNQVVVPRKDITNTGFSFTQAIKWTINNQNFLRVSYENTYRLPDQEEVFGDNNLILPNYSLKPEQSNNFNLGYVFQSQKFRAEANVYYRNTMELIRLKALNQYQAIFMNLDKVKGFGLELDANYQALENFNLSGNLTWNNYRLNASNDPLLNNQHYKNARIANMPFYFTNLSSSYDFKKLLNLKNPLLLFADYSYVHQYYLDYIEKQFEPDGFLRLWGQSKINTGRIIPVQHLLGLGINYSTKVGNNRMAFSFALKNVLNYKIYNEFKMESPGINYRLKLIYTF
ncbi:MAG TPA: TonB-dependent receptor [Edaphocola sp.]|nr:TonB-dependent receptor [Edaphocola sp.]